MFHQKREREKGKPERKKALKVTPPKANMSHCCQEIFPISMWKQYLHDDWLVEKKHQILYLKYDLSDVTYSDLIMPKKRWWEQLRDKMWLRWLIMYFAFLINVFFSRGKIWQAADGVGEICWDVPIVEVKKCFQSSFMLIWWRLIMWGLWMNPTLGTFL